MTKVTTKPESLQPATELAADLFDNRIDPIATEMRARARQFIEELIHGETRCCAGTAARWTKPDGQQ